MLMCLHLVHRCLPTTLALVVIQRSLILLRHHHEMAIWRGCAEAAVLWSVRGSQLKDQTSGMPSMTALVALVPRGRTNRITGLQTM
jgi:hypothetical protein